MRPLTALLGILMGSAVALATGLLMTWIVILFLPAEQARFAPEHAALMRAIAVFTLFSAASAGSFYGELRERPWRAGGRGGARPMPGVGVRLHWPKRGGPAQVPRARGNG